MINNDYIESLEGYLSSTRELQTELASGMMEGTEHIATVAICVHKIDTLLKDMPEYFNDVSELLKVTKEVNDVINFINPRIGEISKILDEHLKEVKDRIKKLEE